MVKTNHSRLIVFVCLSLIVVLAYSACGAPTPMPNDASSANQTVPLTQPPETEQPTNVEQCASENNSQLVCRFSQENGSLVTVVLPWQGRNLVIERHPFDEDLGSPPAPNDFTLLRSLINLQVIDPNFDNVVVHDFNPPLIMTAEYNQDDLDAVGGDPYQLSIAVYDRDAQVMLPYYAYIDENSLTGTITIDHWTSHTFWASPPPPPPYIETFTQYDGVSQVTIELPWQGRPLNYSLRVFDEDLGPLNVPEGYEFIRPIDYIQVIDPNNDNSIVHDFNPPLVMTAQYSPGVLEAVDNDPNKLVIAIYDHEKKEFQPYYTYIDPSSSTGRITVQHWTSHACWLKR